MTGVSTRMDGEIAAIDVLSRDQLAVRWTKIYGQRPPAIRRELLSHAVAWDLQLKRLGGYSPVSMTVESGPCIFAQKGPPVLGVVKGTPVSARSGEAGRGCAA